jgi:hypothetical protein
MRTDQLAKLLREAYDTAPDGDKSLAVCLFGVRYAEEIGPSTNAILESADIGKYGPEVRKGIKLSRYVTLK